MGDEQAQVREAWVRIPSAEELEAAGQRPNYDWGFVPAMSRLILAHPRIGPKLKALAAENLFGAGVLSLAERELLASVAAAAQDCHYCTDSHAEFLRASGTDAEVVEAVKTGRWREAASLTERERALCTVAEKLSATPTKMTEADWQPLRDLGFDDLGILEVAHLVAHMNYATRLADGLGLQLDAPTVDAGRSGQALVRSQAAPAAQPSPA